LDNIYCEHCHTGFPTYPPMAYVTNFSGSLLINGCSIKPGTTQLNSTSNYGRRWLTGVG